MATPDPEFDTKEFSEEERVALLELRALILDILPERHNFDNDTILIKWLRARKLNPPKAEKMIRQHFAYLETNGLNYIDKWRPPEVLTKYLPYGSFGEDREGRPVEYFRFGQMDINGISRSASKIELLRMMHRNGELLEDIYKKNSDKYGMKIDQLVLVVDLEGLGLHHFYPRGLSYLKATIRGSEDNYPETMARILVITNSPVFHLGWEFASHFIDDGTKKKIHFIRPSECEEKMTQFIAPQELPQCYGGTATFPDTICQGGIVPEKFYLKNILDERQLELSLVLVNARSFGQIQIEVLAPKSILCWIFKTDNYDINFAIYFQPLGDTNTSPITDLICVWPLQRCDSQVVPNKGDIMCHMAGIYILYFDNTYSWFHNKEVHYLYHIVPPNTYF